MSNEIPEHLRSDHLFILVGLNPIPAWVAARRLLKESGQIYWVVTEKSDAYARRLTQVLRQRIADLKKPLYIHIDKPTDAVDIRNSITPYLLEIKSGQVGLNYTGGTAMMAIHSHRAVDSALPKGLPAPIYSYLDAASDEILIENYPTAFQAGHLETTLEVEEFVELHSDEATTIVLGNKRAELTSLTPITNFLAGWLLEPSNFKAWSKTLSNARRKQTPIVSLYTEISHTFSGLNQIISDVTDTTDLNEQLDVLSQPTAPISPVHWLTKGYWLEDYVEQKLAEISEAANLHAIDTSIVLRKSGQALAEIDAAATKTHHLIFLSSSMADKKSIAKQKLFEATTRVRQFGGDHAYFCVVTFCRDVDALQKDFATTTNNIKVFGPQHLPQLDQHLLSWLNTIH